MYVDDRVELRLGRLRHTGVQPHPGVVHQVVELVALPVLRQCRLHGCGKCGEARAERHIQRQGDSAAAHLLDLGHHGQRVVTLALVGQHHVSAARGQRQRGAPAQAAATSGDQRYRRCAVGGGGACVHGASLFHGL